jgi:hypothetical protein
MHGERPRESAHAGDTLAEVCMDSGTVETVRAYAHERNSFCDRA